MDIQIKKRGLINRNKTEIENLKKGYSIEEILQAKGKMSNSSKITFIKQMNIRLDKYIELGIITKEEIQLARIKRKNMQKNKIIEEDER